MMKIKLILSIVMLSLVGSAGHSLQAFSVEDDGLRVADIFQDHMVLQRDKKVPVWGTAAAGEEVILHIASKKYESVADSRGRWHLLLDAMPAGGPHEMTVSSQKTKLHFEDIYIGDVWLASGQSNMAFRLAAAVDPDKESAIANSHKLNIRTYEVAKVVGGGRVLNEHDRPWARISPENASQWSAVGFYFARGLHDYLDVPIGIINCNQGGSTIEAWMSENSLKESGVPEERFDGIFAHYKNRSTLYRSMLSDIIPFALKGVLWYQGESNAHAPAQYDDLLSAMIGQWRKEWDDPELPFLIAQLPDFARKEDQSGTSWAELREAQKKVVEKTSKAGMVVLIDAGDKNDIHPTNKRVVGERFVLAARAVAYGEKADYRGPEAAKVRYKKDHAVVNFKYADEGFKSEREEIAGFEIRDENGLWHSANARVVDRSIKVSNDEVRMVSGVRYAWSNAPDVNLFDRSGLPAAPFLDIRNDEKNSVR